MIMVMDEELQRIQQSAADGWARARELDARVRQLERYLASAWEYSHKLDAALKDYQQLLDRATYNAFGLAIWDKVVPFLSDARFLDAHDHALAARKRAPWLDGVEAGLHQEWTIHVLCWVATQAARLPGDFVECGVNVGQSSAAVCRYVDFNRLDRDFWLFDTFSGIPLEHVADSERPHVNEHNGAYYRDCYDEVRATFAPYSRAHLVRGVIPESLSTVQIDQVAYLHVDMNNAAPEIAALEFFWPKLAPGAFIVLDDYGWEIYRLQREGADAFARRVGVEILTLPTGQGVLLRP
jgi:O-methyltransferase